MKIQERNDLIERRQKLRALLAQIDELLMSEVPESTESGTVGIGEKEVVEYLLDIGLSPALSGFRYATTAVMIWLEVYATKGHCSMTKEVYPLVAKEYGTTASRVERAMRHAVERMVEDMLCTKNNSEFEQFSRGHDIANHGLTNSEFIAMVGTKLNLSLKG